MPNRLGPGRDLSRGQIAGQDRKRAPRDGIAAQPGHQLAATGRPDQHRRRQPASCPRPAADATAASGRMSDFAGSLPACPTVNGHPGGAAPLRGM